MVSSTLHVQNSQNTTSTQATRTGTFANLTRSDIERQGLGGEGRHAYFLQPPAIQAFIAGCAEGALQAEVALITQNGEVEEAIHSAKSALLLRLVLTGENLTIQQERERGFVVGLIDTLIDAVVDALESQRPAPTEAPGTTAPPACTCKAETMPTNPATRGELTATLSAIDGYSLGQFHLQSLRGLILGMRAAAHDAETVRHVANSADHLIDDFSHTNATELATLNTQLDALKAGNTAQPDSGLLAAAKAVQELITTNNLCIKFESPSNAHDPRRDVLAGFAAAVASAEGGT